MNELLRIDYERQTVSARELYKKLEVKYDFKRWVDSNFRLFVENKDYFAGHTDVRGNQYGGIQTILDFDLTINMAEHICLMSQTDKGMECRQYLIDLQAAWNTPEQVMARALKMADATITKLSGEISVLNDRIEEMQPKAIFSDAITASDSTILVREFAKILKQNGVPTGEKRFYKQLVNENYLIKRQNGYEPTQRAMELKLFEIAERPVDIYGETQIKRTVRITTDGQKYFINKYLGKGRNTR